MTSYENDFAHVLNRGRVYISAEQLREISLLRSQRA